MLNLVASFGRRAAVSLVALSAVSALAGEPWPKRRAGLWETTMALAGQPGMPAMKSQQCIDAKSDEAMQKRALTRPDEQTTCSEPVLKKSGAGTTYEVSCNSAEGKARMVGQLRGDMQKAYTVENTMLFDPPRHGMASMKMTLSATHVGPCPADMKPGEVRMAGAATMPGAPAGFDIEKLKNMTPEQQRQWAEEMKKSMGQ